MDRREHKRRSRSRSRSRDRDRSRERRERRNKPSRFDDPNPEKLPEFTPPPGTQPVPAPVPNPRRSKWSSSSISDPARVGMVAPSSASTGFGGFKPALMDPALLATDMDKIKKKIYLPKDTTINYIGLIIGPKGMYQKKLEEQTGCRILIRGKGSMPKESQKDKEAREAVQAINPLLLNPEDDEEQHVLIVGDNEKSIEKAEAAINLVLNADEETRNAIRASQLQAAQEMNNTLYGSIDESFLTPYGPPSPSAYIIPVPNECIGLIIGKGGETIRQLQQESGAKIQVAKKEVTGTSVRNVFVEGTPERYEHAKRLIEAIVEEHQGNFTPEQGTSVIEYPVPNNMVGLLIGKGGDNLKKLMIKTRAMIHIPKVSEVGRSERLVQIKGTKEQIENVKREIAIFTSTLSKAASASQLREKQQAVAAISMYLPPSYSIPGSKPEEKKEMKPEEKALLDVQRHQQIQAELANYAGIYQQCFANYDPLYAQYFQNEYQARAGKGTTETSQREAAAAVQEAYTNYNSYYNGYLESGYVPPQQNEGKKEPSGRPHHSGGRSGRY